KTSSKQSLSHVCVASTRTTLLSKFLSDPQPAPLNQEGTSEPLLTLHSARIGTISGVSLLKLEPFIPPVLTRQYG
ncbi:hypothetical protein AVEN_129571-1, partial [Araneus ventricosus]